jgi:hypothetical protein
VLVRRRNINAALIELARRRDTIPVAHKFTDLWTPSADPHAFFKALDVTLRRTIKRRLDSTDPWTEPYWDPVQTAIEGDQAWLAGALASEYQGCRSRLREKRSAHRAVNNCCGTLFPIFPLGVVGQERS